MKKFSKMLALGMAAALVFGMSVNAAGSVTTDAVETSTTVNAAINEAGLQDSAGNPVGDLKVEATTLPEDVYSEAFGQDYEEAVQKVGADSTVSAAVSEAFATLGVSGEKKVRESIIDVSVVEGEIPAGGIFVPIIRSEGGAAFVVAHWNGTSWDVLKTKVEGGFVYALFGSGFSPVYVSILTVTGEDTTGPTPAPGNDGSDTNNTDSTGSTDNTGSAAPASPKTGEAVPVAGILAVACLAGAAACAKKARCSR